MDNPHYSEVEFAKAGTLSTEQTLELLKLLIAGDTDEQKQIMANASVVSKELETVNANIGKAEEYAKNVKAFEQKQLELPKKSGAFDDSKKKLEEEKRRQEEIERKKAAEAKKRYEDYWNANLELKNSLENEKEELLEEINVYQKRLKNMKEKTLLERLVEDKERRETTPQERDGPGQGRQWPWRAGVQFLRQGYLHNPGGH